MVEIWSEEVRNPMLVGNVKRPRCPETLCGNFRPQWRAASGVCFGVWQGGKQSKRALPTKLKQRTLRSGYPNAEEHWELKFKM